MFKKKENSMTYFLGGAAVGMAGNRDFEHCQWIYFLAPDTFIVQFIFIAGLLAGKLLSKSTARIQSFGKFLPAFYVE